MLLVDDSDDDFTLIVRELQRAGHHPVARRVVDEPSMRAVLELTRWDVVLCDSSMPGFSPVDAANLLAQKCADVPLILVTGRAQASPETLKALEMGARHAGAQERAVAAAGVLESELVGPAPPVVSGTHPTGRALEAGERPPRIRDDDHCAALGRMTGSIANEACSSPLMTNIEQGHLARAHFEEIEKAALRVTILIRMRSSSAGAARWRRSGRSPQARSRRRARTFVRRSSKLRRWPA